MSRTEIFEILQIPATRNENEIRTAYHRVLTGVNPEDNPEGFKKLRKAYEEALNYARTPENGQRSFDVTLLQNQEIGGFMKHLADIYDTLSRRLNLEEWKDLLADPVLLSLEDGETAKWSLFSYLAEHYRLPYPVWKLLDEKFLIQEEQQEFKEHLPENFVDYLIRKFKTDTSRSSFPYEKLTGRPDADYDGFIQEYMSFINEHFDWTREALAEKGRRLEKIASYGISHPWYDLECIRYQAECGEQNQAAALVKKLIEENPEDERICITGAGILTECGEKTYAFAIWTSYLTWEEQTSYGKFQALSALAGLEAEAGRWESAKQLSDDARSIWNTEEIQKLQEEIHRELIAEYTQRGDRLTGEEAELLGWCFIQSGEYQAGIRFFDEHPEYEQNTAVRQKQMAILNMYSGSAEEALRRTAAWRKCLAADAESRLDETEPDEALTWEMALSAHIEARIYNNCYAQEIKKEEPDPDKLQKIASQALQWHDRALSLRPEHMEFLIHKLTLLRDMKEDRKVIDLCEHILTISPSFFWACSYMQEAYENLRMAQQVVDTFYRAKNIYAGNSEIYLRAVRVFLAYRQYEDALGIIRQAEEANAMSPVLQVKKACALCRRVSREDQNAWKTADEYTARMIEEMSSNGADQKLLAELYLERAYLNENTDDFHEEQQERTLQYARKSLELDDNTNIRYFLGRFYLNYKKDYEHAYEHLKVCENRKMDFTWMYLYLGRCQEYFKNYDAALSCYEKAMEKDPDFRDALWRMGWIWRNKFKRTLRAEYADKALYYFDQQEQKFGAFTDLFRWRSYIYLCLREYDRALLEASKGIEREADSGLLLLKGRALRKLGRYEEALEAFESSISSKDRYGNDDSFCYGRIFQCFLAQKKLKEGIAYFQKVLQSDPSQKIREVCLEYMSEFASIEGDHDQALRWVEQWYGSLDLSDQGTDTWERTADRIRDVLNVWLIHQTSLDELFYQKCRDAAELAQKAMRDKDARPEDQASLCYYVGTAYLYAGDWKTAYAFLNQAHCILEDPESFHDYKNLMEHLMRCCWWMGDSEKAGEYGKKYLAALEKDYKECSDLGLSMEELLTSTGPDSKLRLYQLACYAFFTGQYEKARHYTSLMCAEKSCWWCREEGCTEEWEIRGMLDFLDKKYKEAREDFEHANRSSWVKGTKAAHMMLRILLDK